MRSFHYLGIILSAILLTVALNLTVERSNEGGSPAYRVRYDPSGTVEGLVILVKYIVTYSLGVATPEPESLRHFRLVRDKDKREREEDTDGS